MFAIEAGGDKRAVADLLYYASVDEFTHQAGGADVLHGDFLGLLLFMLQLVELSHLSPHFILTIKF